MLFLRENVVAALGEGDVHIIPGYGTGDILFLVVKQLSLGLQLSVIESVRIRAGGRCSAGNALQGRVFVGKGKSKGPNAHQVSGRPGGSLEGRCHGAAILLSGVVIIASVFFLCAGDSSECETDGCQKAEEFNVFQFYVLRING